MPSGEDFFHRPMACRYERLTRRQNPLIPVGISGFCQRSLARLSACRYKRRCGVGFRRLPKACVISFTVIKAIQRSTNCYTGLKTPVKGKDSRAFRNTLPHDKPAYTQAYRFQQTILNHRKHSGDIAALEWVGDNMRLPDSVKRFYGLTGVEDDAHVRGKDRGLSQRA
jgi:hypothetical protein